MIEFQKLDARYRGFPAFNWAMAFGYFPSGSYHFRMARIWCWETFGASDEYDIWYRNKDDRNPNWSWDFVNKAKLRIYLNEEAYSWAILKWKN